MDSRTIIRLLEADGWRFIGARGSHHQFDHPVKRGKVTVVHPIKDIPIGTLHKIEIQSGLKLRKR